MGVKWWPALQGPWGSNRRVSSGTAAYLCFIFTSVFFGIYLCFLLYLRLYSLISMSFVFMPVHPIFFIITVHDLSALDRYMDVYATSQKSRLCPHYKRNCTICTTPNFVASIPHICCQSHQQRWCKKFKVREIFPYLTRKEPLWNLVECVLFHTQRLILHKMCNFKHSV